MKDMETPHKRMQELCDCFAETDPLKEMAMLHLDNDKEEAALKWLALAVLHGVDRNAKEISLTKTSDGSMHVTAVYRDTELPSPGKQIGNEILEAAKRVSHIDDKEGQTPLAIGIRDSSLEIGIRIREEGGSQKISLEFK